MKGISADIPRRRILSTDFYEFTMANLYFRCGVHQMDVQFEYFFRSYPDYGAHKAGFCVFAGLQTLIEWMQEVRFDAQSLESLRGCRAAGGEPMFADDFLGWLRQAGGFDSLSVKAVSEGRVVHPQEPIVIVKGPLAVAQILESALLNHLNYQTLIATKAARLKEAGNGQPLLEFGLRRGPDCGADAGTRAALIGGADYSSNTGVSLNLGLAPKGTHAHSMVQLFMALGDGELGAFQAYAASYPDDCLLLVDTVNTLESGVPNAIRVFEELRRKGHQPVGIRLDSGDLAYLSIRAAQMLDTAGFTDARIVLSNNIDEMVLLQVMRQIRDEAPGYGIDPDSLVKRLVYGVGTRLITSQGCGALDGVYKLASVKSNDRWIPALKISETPEKTITPGPKQVWRVYDRMGMATADCITIDNEEPLSGPVLTLHHPVSAEVSRTLFKDDISHGEPLCRDILDEGRLVEEIPSLTQMRIGRDADLKHLDPGVKRLINPHVYHVSLSDRLWRLKQEIIRAQGDRP